MVAAASALLEVLGVAVGKGAQLERERWRFVAGRAQTTLARSVDIREWRTQTASWPSPPILQFDTTSPATEQSSFVAILLFHDP